MMPATEHYQSESVFLKCESGGEEAMCEITKSFVEEGKVVVSNGDHERLGFSSEDILGPTFPLTSCIV